MLVQLYHSVLLFLNQPNQQYFFFVFSIIKFVFYFFIFFFYYLTTDVVVVINPVFSSKISILINLNVYMYIKETQQKKDEFFKCKNNYFEHLQWLHVNEKISYSF